jgi:hypothetical protein
MAFAVTDWVYRGEGGANVVVAYVGESESHVSGKYGLDFVLARLFASLKRLICSPTLQEAHRPPLLEADRARVSTWIHFYVC